MQSQATPGRIFSCAAKQGGTAQVQSWRQQQQQQQQQQQRPPRKLVTVDVRAALKKANPHHEPSLKLLTGLDPAVREYVQERAPPGVWDALVSEVMSVARAGADVAVMCVGGQHRSVAVAEQAARMLGGAGAIHCALENV
jgi:UPF0042 nucleotide-binding protein